MTPDTAAHEETPVSDRAWKALEDAYDLQEAIMTTRAEAQYGHGDDSVADLAA